MSSFKLYNVLIDEDYFCNYSLPKRRKVENILESKPKPKPKPGPGPGPKPKKTNSRVFRFSKNDIILSRQNMLYNVVERT